MKVKIRIVAIIAMVISLASCDPQEVLDPPYVCFVEVENATTNDLTLLVVRHEPTYPQYSDAAPFVSVTSHCVVNKGEVHIPNYSRVAPYIQWVDVSNLWKDLNETRFVFFEGDISDELSKLPIIQKGERGCTYEQGAWDEYIEDNIIFELNDDVFTPELWRQRIQNEPEMGDYWVYFEPHYGDNDNGWHKFVYWSFTLTDEHLAEYAAKKRGPE